jgi:hypothetical protein
MWPSSTKSKSVAFEHKKERHRPSAPAHGYYRDVTQSTHTCRFARYRIPDGRVRLYVDGSVPFDFCRKLKEAHNVEVRCCNRTVDLSCVYWSRYLSQGRYNRTHTHTHNRWSW